MRTIKLTEELEKAFVKVLDNALDYQINVSECGADEYHTEIIEELELLKLLDGNKGAFSLYEQYKEEYEKYLEDLSSYEDNNVIALLKELRKTPVIVNDYTVMESISDTIERKYIPDLYEKNIKFPKDSRAYSWFEQTVEQIFVHTDIKSKELFKEIYNMAEKIGNASVAVSIANHVNFAKCERSAEIRKDFASAFDKTENGSSLSSALGYGFSETDIKNLAILHKDDTEGKYREKIEDLLEDCNFHYECGKFADGEYDEFIEDKEKEEEEERE